MTRCTAEERALARANIYRVLALTFSYPTADVSGLFEPLLPRATVAAELLGGDVAEGVAALREALDGHTQREFERAYQSTFSITYSGECPLWETAFSASQIFQQNAQLADIAGFYRAFGVDVEGERQDHLATELEFMFFLALREAHARARGEREHIRICRDAQRTFMRDHLARWAPLIGHRVALRAGVGPHAAAGRLLVDFIATDQRFLRLGHVELLRDEPVLIADEPGEMTCPYAGDAGGPADANTEPMQLPFFESPAEAQRALSTSAG